MHYKNIFKNNNQIIYTVTTRRWVLSIEWTRTYQSIGMQMKNWWWFQLAWMVDVVIQGVWVLYRIKDKDDESLPLLAFLRQVLNVIFLKYSMEGRLSSSHLGFRSIPSDVCYDDTKHYQVRSEHRRIQNTFKHRRGSVFAYTVNSLKSLTGYTKTLHLICLKGFCTPLLMAGVRCRKITLNAAT